MALIVKDEQDLALLEIVEDPIWFGEFLRSTSDGAPDKEEWPRRPFEYLWYQKDLLTDQSANISLVAGRSVGKCSPASASIYTVDGYKSIYELLERKERTFGVYARDEHDNFVPRRAELVYNAFTEIYKLITTEGLEFRGTANHPVLTQHGYVEMQNINKETDLVAVATSLPWESNKEVFSWYDLRYLGYTLGNGRIAPRLPMHLKFQAQIVELQKIASEFGVKLRQDPDGRYRLFIGGNTGASYARKLLKNLYPNYAKSPCSFYLPSDLMSSKKEHIKIYLESFLSLYGIFTSKIVSYSHPSIGFIKDTQELLLRFGIETKLETIISQKWGREYRLTTATYSAYYNVFNNLDIPGVQVQNLIEPFQIFNNYRFTTIANIEEMSRYPTYSLYVHYDHNYISDGMLVHNSIVLEDKVVHESVNPDIYFPEESKEQLITTANQAQIEPVLSRLILRFTNSRFLSGFLKGNINRSKGTFDFPLEGRPLPYRIYTRIAGKAGESNNLVGLHVTRIKLDESQLYPMSAWTQVGPVLNSWLSNTQIFCAGVPNNQREGNVLFMLDQQNPNFKKYRIPAPNNIRWSLSDHIEALRKYGGEDSNDFLALVLGRHGIPTVNLIPYESIKTEPYEFYSYRYSGEDKVRIKTYKDVLSTPAINDKLREHRCVLAIDTGFTDPTLIQVFGQDAIGVWRVLVRYRLTRIPYPEQADIIDWIADSYRADHISLDLGAAGVALFQDLLSERFPRQKQYVKRVSGVSFNEMLVSGTDPSGNELRVLAKEQASQQLARLVEGSLLRFSELDMEGISQVSRIASTRLPSGHNKYFVMSDRGAGASGDDHIYASFVVMMICLATTLLEKKKNKRRFTALWSK